MSLIVTLSGSPSFPSRSQAVADQVGEWLRAEGWEVQALNVRNLPAQALLHARTDAPEVQEALALVQRAEALVVTTPVYKASFSGVLKSFLDLLPQFGLRGKTVLPLLTGGTIAHVLALDYGLRPVLQSLDPRLVVSGLFVLDKLITVGADGGVTVDAEIAPRLEAITKMFIDAIERLPAPEAS